MTEDMCVAGNYVYVTGEFYDTLIFDTDTIISRKVRDVFLAKYDLDGNVQWAVSGGSNGEDFSHAVTADDSGNVYIIGEIGWSGYFGDHFVPRYGGVTDIFFAKYDPAGVCRWAKSAGSDSYDYGSGIKVVHDDLFITGTFASKAVFDTMTVSPAVNKDLFIARYKTNGKLAEFVQGNGKNVGAIQDMTADKFGNVYVTGLYNADLTIGDTTLYTRDGKNTYLLRYKSGKGFIWFQAFRLAGALFPSRYLACDKEDNVIFSGAYRDYLMLGTISLDTVAKNNVFLALLDSTGSFNWVVNAGGSITADPIGCSSDTGQNYYMAGEFGGKLIIGQAIFDGSGDHNIFLAKAVEGSSFKEENHSRQSVNILVKPNPADHIVNLSYSIPVAGAVAIYLYDVKGKMIRTLDECRLQPGEYSLRFDVSGLPAGVYFVKLRSENIEVIRKILVVR